MEIRNHIEQFSNELTRKGYRNNSIKNYISCVTSFLEYFKDKPQPKSLNEKNIKDYLAKFKDHNTQRANHSAIKCFYKYVVRQPDKFKYIEYCKRVRKLPIILSQGEIQQLFDVCKNLKHRAILALLYSGGLRVSEVINLKPEHIDSKRMVINILDAKGGKDRQVALTGQLLRILREYWISYRPKNYLFNGQLSDQYSVRSIGEFIKNYAKEAGLNRRVYPHLMRHTALTHLLESGTELAVIQRLAGHSDIKTTQLYCHISHNLISKVSPLNNIML